MRISISFICSNRRYSLPFFPVCLLISVRYGPHKVAKILHNAFCQPEASINRLEPDLQTETSSKPSNGISSPDPPLLSPNSATQDFANITTKATSPNPQSYFPLPTEPINIPETVTSPTPNQPSMAESQTHPPPPQTLPSTSEPQGLRVLLVEDNEINLKLLIATMRKLKLEHATATNGLEAFNSYKESEGRFDVVFMGSLLNPFPLFSFIQEKSLTFPQRYFYACNVRHRIYTAYSSLRKRKQPPTRRPDRTYWSRKPEYQTRSI